MKQNKIDTDDLLEVMNEHQWIKYILFSGGTVIGIWILGKASKLLADALVNIKSLRDAIIH